jgi:hypothetical protein
MSKYDNPVPSVSLDALKAEVFGKEEEKPEDKTE